MAVDIGEHPFVGRVETVEALHRRFEDARAGNGGVTFLVGETGVGKSTLVSGLLHDMRARGVRVLEGRAPAADAPSPFALIRSALESSRGPAPAGDSPPSTGGLGDGVLIGFAPRIGDEEFRSPVRVEERILAALGESTDAYEGYRDPFWSQLAEQFWQFVRRGPTVLVVEDLHRADDSSLDALQFLANQLRDRSLWILATVRPYSSLTPARRSRLEAFEKATGARRIALGPLTSSEVAEFLKAREPGRDFSDEEIARRYSETGGNPLLLEQIDRRFREVRSVGAEAPVGGTRERPAPLPHGQEEERALAVAAVIGPEIPFGLLLRASGEEEERLAETVDRLVGRGLLLERPGEVLTFADERRRGDLYEQLTESRRRLLHRRVGEALEATGSADMDTLYAVARHFYLGKVDEKALNFNRIAAEMASRLHAPDVARAHLERALESFRRVSPSDVTGETELVLELAREIDHAGELKDAETLLRHHLARPGLAGRLPASLLTLAETYLARIQTDRGDWTSAEEATARLLRTAGLERYPAVVLALRHLRGEALFYGGRYAEALAEHDEELRLARERGNERAAALGRSRRASVLAMMGRAEEALKEGREAARTLEHLGELRDAAHAHMFVGVVTAGLKGGEPRLEESLSEFLEATRLAEVAHDPRRVGWALFNAADVLREARRFEEAADRNQRARELLERIGDRFGLVQSLIVSGKIALDRGEYDRSEADLLDAYRLVRELKAPADEVDVVLRLAQLSYARGDVASARRRVVELERQNLPALRPDVATDFDRLKRALSARERAGTDATTG